MRKWYPLALFVLMLAASIVAYPRLPERVPSHWNIYGQIDRYSSRGSVLFIMPFMMLVLWGLMRGLPKIDPRRENFAKMQAPYDLVINAALTIMAVAHVSIIAKMFGASFPLPRIMPALIGVLFVVIGNVLPQARPNFFFGIRTPWTLSSDRVWVRTHRVGGYLMVGAGIVAILSVALPVVPGLIVMFVAVASAALGSVVYSYIAWKQEQSE